MSSAVFQIKEHTLECQHIREYARATANSQEEVLHLAIKQYIPLDNQQPQPGDLTIIGAHANGFPKVNLPNLPFVNIANVFRNCMSRCGKISTPVLNQMASGYEAYG
jgi:hypothetical protein